MLSDEFSHLKKDVRQSVLFYGSARRVVVASVEIIFDNTDKQLPVRQILIMAYSWATFIYVFIVSTVNNSFGIYNLATI